jgi:phosphoserine phosphatase RsbU/P
VLQVIRLLNGRSRAFHYILVILQLAVVAVIDCTTDRDLSFAILYLLPVIEAAWFLGKREGYAACVLSGAIWFIEDLRESGTYSRLLIPYWNLAAKLALFLILISLVTALKESLEHERRMLEERMRRGLEIARQVQSRLLPQQRPEFESLDLATAYRPARQVGGDYYDWLVLGPNVLALAVADVCGKGLSAALLMASLQGMLRANAPFFSTRTSDFLKHLNRLLFHSTDTNRYATLFYCVYNKTDRILRYVNAGHDPPLLLRHDPSDANAGCQLIRLDRGGPPVGILEQSRYEGAEMVLQTGDLLVIFTDGVTEAQNQQEEEFGEQRLIELVSGVRDSPASVIGDRILDEVARFAGDCPQSDDITLMVVKIG